MKTKLFAAMRVVFVLYSVALAQGSATQVDNCCFIDRQCQSDAEWTNGYWAFQDGQCAAPASFQPQASAQPAGNVSSQVDNCCFVDRQCSNDEEWVNGFWAFQNGQCTTPQQSQQPTSTQHGIVDGVIIEGSPEYIAFVKETLGLLRTRSRKWYNYVISGPARIVEDHNTMVGHYSSRSVYTRSYRRSIVIGNHEQNLLAMATILQHEACHAHREAAGFPYNQFTKVSEEYFCVQLEDEMLDSIDPYNQSLPRAVVGHAHCKGSLENSPLCERYKTPWPRHLIQCHYDDESRCEDMINWLTSPKS